MTVEDSKESGPKFARTDTIAAIATAPGRGAIGVLRLSGPEATNVAKQIAGPLPAPRTAVLRDFLDTDGRVIDRGLVLFFRAPHSFTGENVVELQGHGGPLVMSLLMEAACRFGARPARPGEFSERAFLNGQLDLAQAEAIADLIDAGSAAAVRAASRTLHGEFSERVTALVESLIGLRADLEAALDFSDEEDVPWLNGAKLSAQLTALNDELQKVLRSAAQGRRLREGLSVAIVGQPNVGKSTLLNRLAGTDAAIVSPIPGTTRDVLREQVVVDGLPLNLVDTAGLRETADMIEQEGIRRAWAASSAAELVLYIVDDRFGITEADQKLLARIDPDRSLLFVHNKCDIATRAAERFVSADGKISLRLSAATGLGLDLLIAEIKRAAGLGHSEEGLFTARARHIDALTRALTHIDSAVGAASSKSAPELVAEELRLAQQALDEITGRFSSEDLLGRIFSSFCIGK